MTVYDQEVSRKIFDLVNEERVKEGHAAMIWMIWYRVQGVLQWRVII